MNTKTRRDRCPHRHVTRIVSLLLSITMLLTLTAGLDFSAYAVLNGDYEYTILDDGTIEINKYKGSASELVIPSNFDDISVTSIGDRAFMDCYSLVSVKIPDSIISIGKEAFWYCERLTNIIIPNSVTTIGDYAFSECTSLVNITIPDSISSISDGLFYFCYNLENVTIPNSVTSIGNEAFFYCSKLIITNIPNSVISIGDRAFYDCNDISVIVIPNSVTNIGFRAFQYCSMLQRIIMSDSVTNIGESAFESCVSLHEVYYTGSEEQWKNISIGYDNSNLHFSDIHYNVEKSDFYRFLDLDGFENYADYVIYTSVYNEFLKGTNPPYYNYFHPNVPITRAMFVAILYRMAGNPYDGANPYTSNPFSDINTNAYYYNAACWALDEGITNQTTFKPNNNVTREQTARFLFAYAESKGLLGDEAYKNVSLGKYPDYNGVHSWAVEPLQWANYNDMITGTQQGYINPQGATQRIHATRILYGFGKVCNIGNFE